MTTRSISELLTRYALKQCTPEEEAMVNKWFAEHGSASTDFEQMNAEGQQEWIDILYTDIAAINTQEIKQPVIKKINFWPRIAVAATVLISIGACLFSLYYKSDKDIMIQYANLIKPANSGATLTLPNGKVVQLDDAKAGLVIEIASLAYTDGSMVALPVTNKLIEEKDGNKVSVQSGDLVVSTPNGRQYHLVLPDGTKVWLNAASSLKFSSSFLVKEARNVKLIGEAYFEVSKDELRPFIVKTSAQEVEVLGTHFNINSYAASTITTLLEGSVKVSASENGNKAPDFSDQVVILKPGEQAVQKLDKIQVMTVDVAQTTAWKDGWFYFKSASLQEVLNEAAKWYDLQISYESNVPDDRFTGKVPRTASLGTFIKILQLSDVKFKLEGHKIIVH